jgi:integrase
LENTKSSERRRIPINCVLRCGLGKLWENRKSDEFVFPSRKTGESLKILKKSFKRAYEKAGIKGFRSHDLRHAAASLLAVGGFDIIKKMHILGHKTLSVTQRYAHLVSGRHDNMLKIMEELWAKSSGKVSATKLPQLVVPKNSYSVTH